MGLDPIQTKWTLREAQAYQTPVDQSYPLYPPSSGMAGSPVMLSGGPIIGPSPLLSAYASQGAQHVFPQREVERDRTVDSDREAKDSNIVEDPYAVRRRRFTENFDLPTKRENIDPYNQVQRRNAPEEDDDDDEFDEVRRRQLLLEEKRRKDKLTMPPPPLSTLEGC